MANPWLSIPLDDYEGHMSSSDVQQLRALSELFGRALAICRPTSVAVLGVAGGNGLEHIDPFAITRIVGVDINPRYLETARQRFGALKGLELHCADLAQRELSLAPVELVHAAMIFEHSGLGPALENALSLIAPGGHFSVVLQLPGPQQNGVASAGYKSMETLKNHFAFIDVERLRELLGREGFRLAAHELQTLPAGKAFWFGVFSRTQAHGA